MVEQRVDQRPVEIARGGMDDQPGGLVDDDQMLVLERDDERDILRLVVRRRGSGTATANTLARRGLLGRIADQRRRPSVTAPDAISTFSRSRDSVGTASASARSSRQPAAASATRASMMETPRSMRGATRWEAAARFSRRGDAACARPLDARPKGST